MARARANGPETLRRNRTPLAVVAGALLLAGCQQTVAFKLLDAGGGGSRGMAGAGGMAGFGGMTGFGGMAGFGNAGSDGDVCPISQRVTPTPESPTVIVALDRTTSMTAPLGPPGSGSKLDAVRAALERLVYQYATVVRFGFVGFPGKGPSTGGSCSASGECCSSIVPPSVFSASFDGA